MKVALKLIVGFLVVSLLVGVAGYIGISATEKIHHEFDKVIEETTPLKTALEDVKFAGLRIVSSTSEFALIKSETQGQGQGQEELELVREGKELYNTNFGNYENLVNKFFPEESELAENIRIAGQKLIEKSDEIIELKEKGVSGLEVLEAKKEFEGVETNFLNAVNTATVHENEELITRQQDVSLSIINSTNIILIVSAFIIAIGIIMGVFISRSISRPINKLGNIADKIADGNFDVEVKATSKDEIGELALQFENMRQRIKASRNELEEKDKLKEEFVSMITHELKSPLTPITGYCEALKRPQIMGLLSEKQTRAVDTIYSNSIKLRKLIGDVLDAQKLDLGRMKFDNDKFEIGKLLQSVINDFKFIIEAKKIQLVTSMKEKLTLKSDRQRIGQVLSNLIYNAVDFVPKEKGIIEVKVEAKEDNVIFSVKDNGVGISKDEQKKLFGKFFQVDTSTTRKHGGTGLGLSVCQGLVENLGGKIWVESELGKGATFYFSIPKHKEEEI